MLRQRLFVFASWAVTTMVATLVSAAGVSIVTRDVTDDHNPALAHADVVALLSAPAPTSTTPTTVTVPPSSTETAPPPPTSSASEAPVTTTRPTVPPTTTASPTTRPPLLADAVSATFSAPGGTMTVACLGDTIALVSARPNDGYQLVVYDEGSERVGVRFERDGSDQADTLVAVCERGEPMLADGHDDRRGHDGDGRDGDGRDGGGGDFGSGGSGSGSDSGSGSGSPGGWGFGG